VSLYATIFVKRPLKQQQPGNASTPTKTNRTLLYWVQTVSPKRKTIRIPTQSVKLAARVFQTASRPTAGRVPSSGRKTFGLAFAYLISLLLSVSFTISREMKMQEKEPITSVNQSTTTNPVDAERTVATPHFDAAAVRQARPAVPLAEIRARRSWPVAVMVLMVLGGMAGGVIGGVLSTRYLRLETPPSAVSQEAPASTTTTKTAADESTSAPPAPAEHASQPEDTQQATPLPIPEAPLADNSKNTEDSNLMRQAVMETSRDAQPGEAQEALRAALNEWVAATNARDLGKQLSFYQPTMNAFYRQRNASLADVRADRERVFERAQSIEVRADSPVMQVSPDGRSATMRFLKRYSIAGGGQDRSGTVVQELRWRRVNGKWRIISERDVKVLN
jgi:ketosteroid isomerase-like protein